MQKFKIFFFFQANSVLSLTERLAVVKERSHIWIFILELYRNFLDLAISIIFEKTEFACDDASFDKRGEYEH